MVIGLLATRILNGCRMREMYGIVAVVVRVTLLLGSVVEVVR